MEHKTVPFDFKAKGNSGEFEGYISVFNNVDYGGDVIVPGAFKEIKTNRHGRLKLALYHDLERLVGTASFNEDSTGFHVNGKLSLGVSYVKDAYQLMLDGALDEMSIGYSINKGGVEFKEVDGRSIAYLKDLTLYEGSLVPFGMNPEARVGEVKSVRDVESKLRKEFGLSRREATAVVSIVKQSLQSESVNDGQLGEPEVSAILDFIKTL